jgi:hypothetical protein
MAKVTITFESDAVLGEGPATYSYAVDEQYAPDFVAAIAAHPMHGQIAEQIMADTGQVDENGDPILGPATQVRPSTFREGLKSWADANVRDVIIGATNEFRTRKAQAVALAAVVVEPIRPID